MRGEWIMKVRSTPTPWVTRRTVKFWRRPPPVTRMTVPSNTWMRSRVPSTTFACTLTVSPARSAGTFSFCCSFSSCWMTFMSCSTPWYGRKFVRPQTNNHARLRRQLSREALVETLAPRSHEHDRPGIVRADGIHRLEDRLWLEDHARAAAERHVVHLPVAIVSVVTKVVRIDLDDPPFDATAHDAVLEHGAEHGREDRHDVKPHRDLPTRPQSRPASPRRRLAPPRGPPPTPRPAWPGSGARPRPRG